MSLSTEQKSNQSYKKHKGVADTHSVKAFFEEGISSPVTVFAQDVYQQGEEIPVTAPSHLVNGETEGVITRYIDLDLIPVPGSPDAFYHDNLRDAIPFNFGDGSYNYMDKVKDSLGGGLPPAYQDFEIDPVAGVLRFYAGAPGNMPPKISFYRYTGIKGVGEVDVQDYRIVLDLVERDAIPAEERKDGTLCYVQTGNATYQLQGGIDNTNWELFSVGPPPRIVLNMPNDSSGQQILVDYTKTPSFTLFYRTDRGANYESGEILIDYKDGNVDFNETRGVLSKLGITVDFNTSGNNIVMDWVIDNNVDAAVMSYLIGSLESSSVEGGDMYKAVYDPTGVNGDAFDMANMVESANAKVFTDTERTKLTGIQAGAQVNPASTDELAEGVTNEYYTEAKVSANSDVAANTANRHSHTNKATLDSITEAGSGSIISAAERTKLSGIAPGAEVNQSDAQIKAQYEANPDTNAFTNAEKDKLATIEESKFLGTYTSLSALETAHPSPAPGSYGDVDGGVGQGVVRYIWDVSDNKYEAQLGEGTEETPASVKTKYESNADTNAFTDSEKSKLAGIDPGAQVNPVSTDEVPEGATNEYYTDGKVSANADVTANTANRHSHTNKGVLDAISSQGSGVIISAAERSKLEGIQAGAQVNPASTDELAEGATNQYYTEAKVDANTNVAANSAAKHSHMNKATLDLITDAGSGIIISAAERSKLAGLSEDPIPTNTDELAEGTTNKYYSDTLVSANSDVAANTADRHLHTNKAVIDNITDAGSGEIITAAERTKLSGIEEGAQVNPLNTDELAEGSTNKYYTEGRVSANADVVANTAVRHSHTNKANLDAITDPGSGVIISAAERIKLNNSVTNDHIHLGQVMVSPDGTLTAGAWRWRIDGSDLWFEQYDGASWNVFKKWSSA